MPIESFGLREAVAQNTESALTVYLHTGDPGTAGTTNRVAAGTLGSADIPAAGTGWTYHATLGRATMTTDLSFGNANAAVNGVSWISMFDGTDYFARRELAASVNIANGAPVSITASTMVIEYTSTD